MRVVQLLPTLSFGDAIGNDTIALKGVISEMGYSTDIYAENIDKRLPEGIAKKADKLRDLKKDDVLIYHKSTGTDLTFKIENYKCRRIMVYHNITPPEFFRPYSTAATQLTEHGYKGVEFLRDKVDYVLAVSAYNRSELVKMGYTCPMDIRPILIKFDDYKQTPDEATINKYSDGKKNLVFVGRIAPNKKQENVIRAFFCYKKLNPDSRLILVGSSTGMENYYERLVKYANALGIGDDVIFPGHIKFSEILAYYRLADAFVCMSEHEGFCVPLVEAMFFDTPIIAYDTSAISDTLGGSGVLLDNNDPVFAAAVIDRVLTDEKFRESIIAGQRKRLEDFSYERIKATFERELTDFINGKKATE
jgi:glycosyltransferase involved in cell wall biosynthesis